MQKKRGPKKKSITESYTEKQLSLRCDDLSRLDEIVAYRTAHNESDRVVMRSGVVRDLIFSAYREINC